MLILCYDFETSGMVLWKEPSADPRQPHIVQAAAALVDTDTRKTLASLNLIAYPAGWEIPEEIAAIHGITTEQAKALGVPERIIIEALLGLWAKAELRVGHNESFDARIARIAIKRYLDEDTADYWRTGRAECTARLARPVIKLPKTKVPTLAEAYEYFCGIPMERAHSAAGDLEACLDVWFQIKYPQPIDKVTEAPPAEDDVPFI